MKRKQQQQKNPMKRILNQNQKAQVPKEEQ